MLNTNIEVSYDPPGQSYIIPAGPVNTQGLASLLLFPVIGSVPSTSRRILPACFTVTRKANTILTSRQAIEPPVPQASKGNAKLVRIDDSET
jgi:hypothetical protein